MQTNFNEVKSIAPSSTDFSDLEALGNAIGDSRIVMLGEQDHGDGPTFLAKTRIIKYLREKKGFSVLAFEADFFALNRGWDKFDKTKPNITSFIRANLPAIWTKCSQCEELLYSYVPESYPEKPLKLTGFDNQMLGWYSKVHLSNSISNYLQSKNLPFTKTADYKENFISYIDSLHTGNDLSSRQKFDLALEEIFKQLSSSENASFEAILLRNVQAGNKMAISMSLNNRDLYVIRDKQMADNLQWLVKTKYPREKIIVWAANSHILKSPEGIVGNSTLLNTMGNFFVKDQKLLSETYILGFSSREGTAGRIGGGGIYTVENKDRSSFENYFPEKIAYAFIDFKKFQLSNPGQHPSFIMKGIGHTLYNAKWTECYDGIFYIRDMYPCMPSAPLADKE